MSTEQDKERGSVKRVSPDVSQGVYAPLGTIAHRDPQTAVGSSPGTVRSIIHRGAGAAAKPKEPGVTTPSGSQPPAKGVTGESQIKRLRRKEGR